MELDLVGVGSMVLDRMHRVARIGAPGDKVAVLSSVSRPGGVVLNHLAWASVLGARAGVFGLLGDDPAGRTLRDAADAVGLAANLVPSRHGTAEADVYVDPDGERTIYMRLGATSRTTPDDVRRHHDGFLSRARFVTTEVSQLPLAAALEVLAIAREAGATTVVDLDVPPEDALTRLGSERELDELLRAADILKPTRPAAEALAPGVVSEELARALRGRYGCRTVVLTDGANGCTASTPSEDLSLAPPHVEVLDATGAGDAFLGGLLAALARGDDWPAALDLANAAGAACCELLGAFPDPAASPARVLELSTRPE